MAQPALAGLRVVDGVPGGFELLVAPRATLVSVNYGGKKLGDFAAHTTPGHLSFDNPAALTAVIPALKKPEAVQAILGRDMPSHTELLCGERVRKGCGDLQPENVGIIFNESRLEAELFVASNYLDTMQQEKSPYLPLPDRAFSSVVGFAGAVNGTDTHSPVYSVSANAVNAYGEGRLTSQTTLTDKGLRFDTAQLGVERFGWGAGAGLFRSRAMHLVGDRDMAGVYASTSLATRLDSHKTEGNDVILYLPRRSFVSISRDGRLYSSRAYEAGNQVIDTSELPEGAYTITLKIEEQGGEVHEEKRFFAKSPDLPPADAPVYFGQMGFMREQAGQDSTLPQVSGDPIVNAGTIRRLDDSLGASFQVLAVKDRMAAEAGTFWMIDDNRLSTAALASTHGDFGMQIGWLYNTDNISLGFDGAALWGDNDPWNSGFFSSYKQATITAGYSFTPDFTFGMRAAYSAVMQSPASFSVGPYAEWRLWQAGESELALSANAARANEEYQGSLFIRFSQRFGDYGVSATGGASLDAAGQHPLGNLRGWHDENGPDSSLLVGAGISGDEQTRSINADADWRNRIGLVRGSVQESLGSNGASFAYGGNFAVNAAEREGDVVLGGMQNDRSAIIIDVGGNAGGTMKIFVNNIERGTVKIGERHTIYMSPFHTYRVRLSPQTSSLVDFEAGERSITLYPGTVVRQAWHVNNFYVVTGHIVDTNGALLANATLEASRDQASSDENGKFQAEITDTAMLRFTKPDNTTCTVTLPPVKPVNGVLLYAEPLICR